METIIGKDVAEKMFAEICEELGINLDALIDEDEEAKGSIKKITSALMRGRLLYEDEVFTLTLLKPVGPAGEVSTVTISEPTGVQLRGMRTIKNKRDDVGKSMAVLGEVSGLGLPVINTFGSRDLMVAVGVLSLFL